MPGPKTPSRAAPREIPKKMSNPAEELRTVEAAWSQVAERYEKYWSPRLRPYVHEALGAFAPPTQGPLLVAGCGPGEELELLARRFPGRPIVGTDLSPAMVALARRRVKEAGLASVLVDRDDAALSSSRLNQGAGVFSSFILQLLPDPVAALEAWTRVLRTGGCLLALFWPRADDASPVARLQRILREAGLGREDDWEPRAIETLCAHGLDLRADRRLEFEMAHASPKEFWNELVESGPLQAAARRSDKETLDLAGKRWLEDHGLERRGAEWVHRPAARLWVFERNVEPLSEEGH